MAEFSDYLIFVDESGDAGLKNIDPDYPILTLAFIVIHKDDYINKIVPSFTALKLKYWGHDEIVFHEHDIRRGKGDFAFLRTDKKLRTSFMNDLSEIIKKNNFYIISTVINKLTIDRVLNENPDLYHVALVICMSNLLKFLTNVDQKNRNIQIIFEARGKNEDDLLELQFKRIRDNDAYVGNIPEINFQLNDFHIRFADKKTNSIGLQLADLVARPIGINSLRKEQANRAYDILEKKIINHMDYKMKKKIPKEYDVSTKRHREMPNA